MPKAKRSPSYPCPRCGGRTEVTDSRPSTIGGQVTVRRRRRCRDCNARWSTWETTLGSGRLEQHLRAMARAIAAAIAALENMQAEIVQLSTEEGEDDQQAVLDLGDRERRRA